MTKRVVVCPICQRSLGSYHSNQADEPVAKHIFRVHSDAYAEIVAIVNEIDERLAKLKTYGVDQWSKTYYRSVESMAARIYLEENPPPPLSNEARDALMKKILNQDDEE